jgi:hypothetical protein
MRKPEGTKLANTVKQGFSISAKKAVSATLQAHIEELRDLLAIFAKPIG